MHIKLTSSKDKLGWDSYVDGHSDAAPYCRFAWKEAVEKAYGHKGCYLHAVKEDVIVGIFPLFMFHIPFSGCSLVSLPFCDVGGILADNDEIKSALFAEAIVLANRLNAKKVEVRSCQESLLCRGIEGYYINQQTDKVRLILKLPGSSGELWKSFKSKLRSQVNKAEKNGLTFRFGSVEDLKLFYQVFSRNMHALGSPVHSKEWIERVLVGYDDNARMGLVFKGDQPVGCGIILLTKDTVSIPWASTLREYNRFSPNMLLYWELLKFATDNGKKTFDFGRSTFGEGTYNFKKQWGAEPRKLYWYSLCGEKRGGGIHISNTRRNVASLWCKLPLGVVNFIGPKLRKYIDL